MQSDQVLQQSERAVFRELAESDGGVLLHLDSGAYHGLNAVGSLIWSLIGEGTTLEDLVVRVREGLTDAPPDLQEDVESFVEDLIERELLVRQ